MKAAMSADSISDHPPGDECGTSAATFAEIQGDVCGIDGRADAESLNYQTSQLR
jgi:hypothetical protein